MHQNKSIIRIATVLFILIFVLSSGCIHQEETDTTIGSNSRNDEASSPDISKIKDTLQSTSNLFEQDNVSKWISIMTDDLEIESNRFNAAEMLVRSEDKRASEPFARILADSDESFTLRAIAAAGLGNTGSEKNTDDLINVLDDEYWAVSRNAAESLGKIGDERAVDPLMDIMENKSLYYEIRAAAAKSLGQLKAEEAAELLIENLKDEKSLVSENAAWSLGEIGDTQAVKPLRNALKYEDAGLVYEAAVALEKLEEPAAEMLIDNLDYRDIDVRKNSANALGLMEEQSAFAPLLEVAQDRKENEEVRRKAIGALGRLRNKDAIAPLISILEEQSEPEAVRTNVPKALMTIDEEMAIEPLIDNLNDENMEVRLSIIRAFYSTRNEEAIKSLENLMLNDEQWRVRMAAAMELQEISGKNSTPAYIKALEDDYWGVRYIVAGRLGLLEDSNATEALINALGNETEQQVRYTIARALGQIGDERSVQELVRIAEDRSEYDSVRFHAVEGLGTIGDRNATIPLTMILLNRNDAPDLRMSVANSLAQISDPGAIEALEHVAEDESEYPAIRERARKAVEEIQGIS